VIEHPLLMKYVIFLGEKSKHQNWREGFRKT
jgi:hypothetical protein